MCIYLCLFACLWCSRKCLLSARARVCFSLLYVKTVPLMLHAHARLCPFGKPLEMSLLCTPCDLAVIQLGLLTLNGSFIGIPQCVLSAFQCDLEPQTRKWLLLTRYSHYSTVLASCSRECSCPRFPTAFSLVLYFVFCSYVCRNEGQTERDRQADRQTMRSLLLIAFI